MSPNPPNNLEILKTFERLGQQEDISIGHRYRLEDEEGRAKSAQNLAGLQKSLEFLRQGTFSIIDEIRSNDIFNFAIGTTNPAEAPNLVQLTPMQSEETEVLAVLTKQAETIYQQLTQAIQNPDLNPEITKKGILLALSHHIRERLFKIHNSPAIPTANGNNTTPFGLGAAITNVKSKLENGEIERDEAILELMAEAGIVNQNEIKTPNQKRRLKRLVRESLSEAQKLFKKKVEFLSQIVDAYIDKHPDQAAEFLKDTNGEEAIAYPEINATLIEHGPFDLMEILFDKGNHDHRNKNDVQALLVIAFKFLEINRHPMHAKSQEAKDELSQALEGCFMKARPSEEEPTATFRRLKWTGDRFEEKRMKKRLTLRNLNIKGSATAVYFEDIDMKEKESTVEKNLVENRYTLTNMQDKVRTRMVIPEMTREDMEGSGRSHLLDIMHTIAAKLNLEYTNDVDSREQGQFRVLRPNPNSKFYKWTLAGVLENGVNFEIQFIPKDTYEYASAENSPLGHNRYKEKIALKFLLRLVPASVSKISHAAINARLAELEEEQAQLNQWFEAQAA